MKVTGPGQPSAPSVRRRAKTGKGFGQSLKASLSAGTDAPEQASAPSGISSVGGLLALQEAPDQGGARHQVISDAETMLEKLEDIRLGLLLGRIPRDQLEKLMRIVHARPGGDVDPRLSEIVEEIELRAAVELAKLDFGP